MRLTQTCSGVSRSLQRRHGIWLKRHRRADGCWGAAEGRPGGTRLKPRFPSTPSRGGRAHLGGLPWPSALPGARGEVLNYLPERDITEILLFSICLFF